MNNLKKLRSEKKISMGRLAEAANVSTQFIYYVESDKKLPSLKTAKAISSFLGYPIEEVFFPTKSTKSTKSKMEENYHGQQRK